MEFVRSESRITREQLSALAELYLLIPRLPADSYAFAHRAGEAGLEALGVDSDSLPDTCRTKAARLLQLAEEIR